LQSIFTESTRQFHAVAPCPVVAWVGRLDRLKNWQGFVDLAARISRESQVPIEFWIVGHGQVRTGPGDLYRYARRREILPNLRWYRNLHPDLMPRLYDAIRDSGGVVVSTSRHESFGLSVAEAMARACPVVAPRAGPFPEFIQDGEQGLLYRPGSSKDAATKIQCLLNDAQARKRLGEAARQRVLAEFSPQAALPHLIRALEKAVSHP
jgi:glycosyltransferase involved in cell wall biosynthesis